MSRQETAHICAQSADLKPVERPASQQRFKFHSIRACVWLAGKQYPTLYMCRRILMVMHRVWDHLLGFI